MNQEQREQTKLWQQQNPEITQRMRDALPKIQEINVMLLDEICDELEDVDSPFAAKDFVDRTGQRLNSFNMINMMFSQLGGEYE